MDKEKIHRAKIGVENGQREMLRKCTGKKWNGDNGKGKMSKGNKMEKWTRV